jgi:hypothetical protein
MLTIDLEITNMPIYHRAAQDAEIIFGQPGCNVV